MLYLTAIGLTPGGSSSYSTAAATVVVTIWYD